MASDVIGDRWTLLIVREMVMGSRRFNELERGLPGISRSLLLKRLRQMESAGVVEAVPIANGRGHEYELTRAGEELFPVLMAMGEWSVRWLFGDPTPEQLDTNVLMWWFHRRVNHDELPDGRTVVRFDVVGAKREVFWLVLQPDDVSLCIKDPGHDVDVHVTADREAFHRAFAGRTTWAEACAAGSITVDGRTMLVRRFPTWFAWSPFYEASQAMVSTTG